MIDKVNGERPTFRQEITAYDEVHENLYKELIAVNEQILGLKGKVRAIRRGLICALIGGACGALAMMLTVMLIR